MKLENIIHSSVKLLKQIEETIDNKVSLFFENENHAKIFDVKITNGIFLFSHVTEDYYYKNGIPCKSEDEILKIIKSNNLLVNKQNKNRILYLEQFNPVHYDKPHVITLYTDNDLDKKYEERVKREGNSAQSIIKKYYIPWKYNPQRLVSQGYFNITDPFYNNTSFGKKKIKKKRRIVKRRIVRKPKKPAKFIAKAVAKMKSKGTVGSFTRWCKSRGLLNSAGKVTRKCVNAGLKSTNPKIRRKAQFLWNIRGYSRTVSKS